MKGQFKKIFILTTLSCCVYAGGGYNSVSCQHGYTELCTGSLKAEVSQLPADYVITIGPESTAIGTVAELNLMSQEDLANKVEQATRIKPQFSSGESTSINVSGGSSKNVSNGQYFSDCATNPSTSWAVGMMASCPMSNTYKYGYSGSLSNGGSIAQVYFQAIYDYRENMPAKNFMTEVDPQPELTIDSQKINLNQYCPVGTQGIIAKDNWHDDYMIACK